MSDTAKRRLAIDLDEIERQLQQSAPESASRSTPPSGASAGHGGGAGGHDQGGAPSGKPDPLAELARIVGQDDPFRSILSGERAGVTPHQSDADHDAVFGYGHDETHPQSAGAPGFDPGQPATDRHGFAGPPPQDPQLYDHDDSWPQAQGQAPGYETGFAPQQPNHPQQPQDLSAGDWPAPDRRQPDWRDEDLYAEPDHGAPQAQGNPPDQDFPRPDLSAPPAYLTRHPGGPGAYPDPYATQADPVFMPADGDYANYEGSLDDLDHAPLLRHERRGNGKALMSIAVILGVAVIGVASALYFVRSTGPAGDGEPPLITAASEPMRIEPADPGGVDIPDQDRQIFERSAENETRVVDREEQPVDVGEIARSSPRVVLPPPASTQSREDTADPISQVLSGTMEPQAGFEAPPEVSAAVAELGEPRRVRTVTVRPDGTIIRNDDNDAPREVAALDTPSEFSALADAQVPQPATERMPWETDPAGETAPQATAGSDAATAGEPSQSDTSQEALAQSEASATTQTETAQTASESVSDDSDENVGQAPTEAPPAPERRQPLALTGALQIAPQAQQSAQSQSPQQTASVAPAQPTGTGDYVVQLGISNSEDRARQAFGQYQSRYSGIIGNSDPIVRRAEVNGNTIYRVRVGPYDLSSANSVCDRIKNTGGDCFVARN